MDDLHTLATQTLEACRQSGVTVATAESCTGGLIAGALTAISGSSDVLDRGFVTYSNQAKQDMLGVYPFDLESYGAVSDVVARQMAEGGLRRAAVGACVAVTGIAGPGGGSAEKPVGLVFIACARVGVETVVERHVFEGERDDVRHATVKRALTILKTQAVLP